MNNINIVINENNVGCLNHDPSLVKKLDYVNNESAIPAIKFLGVNFDSSLNFKYHIEQINTKLSKALFILQRSKNILTPEALLLFITPLFTVI